MKRLTLLLVLVCTVAAAAAAGCGSNSSSTSTGASAATSAAATASGGSSSTSFAKTKFVIHAGLALGAFHRWIYKPVKAGALKHPLSHKLTLVKAGLAAAFVYHELKLAANDTKSSKVLSTLFAPLTLAAEKLNSLKSSIVGGSASEADIDNINTQLAQIGSTASAKGQPISESVPSLSQLSSGSSG
jgi:hypothetical protein